MQVLKDNELMYVNDEYHLQEEKAPVQEPEKKEPTIGEILRQQ